jgi:hypothetical protein
VCRTYRCGDFAPLQFRYLGAPATPQSNALFCGTGVLALQKAEPRANRVRWILDGPMCSFFVVLTVCMDSTHDPERANYCAAYGLLRFLLLHLSLHPIAQYFRMCGVPTSPEKGGLSAPAQLHARTEIGFQPCDICCTHAAFMRRLTETSARLQYPPLLVRSVCRATVFVPIKRFVGTLSSKKARIWTKRCSDRAPDTIQAVGLQGARVP